jgi:hypothetical protein
MHEATSWEVAGRIRSLHAPCHERVAAFVKNRFQIVELTRATERLGNRAASRIETRSPFLSQNGISAGTLFRSLK